MKYETRRYLYGEYGKGRWHLSTSWLEVYFDLLEQCLQQIFSNRHCNSTNESEKKGFANTCLHRRLWAAKIILGFGRTDYKHKQEHDKGKENRKYTKHHL